MTLRTPVVLINGALSELPAGDTIGGIQATSSVSLKYSAIGTLETTTGTVRWYPDKTVTLSSVYFSVGIAPTSSVVFDVLKNGISILTTKPTCTAGNYKSSIISISVLMTINDYLTVDIVAASGANATLCIVYS